MLDDGIYAVHMVNAVHPSEASNVHDGICSTPVGKYRTQSEAPDVHGRIYAVHLMANAAHPSEAHKVHHGLCSTLDG